MTRFLVQRLLAAAPVALGVALGAFAIIHLTPGDPVTQMLGFQATDANVAQVRHELRLDEPLPEQYLTFITGAVRGDFGTSIIRDASVSEIISARVKPSVLLIGYSLLLCLLVAVPLAIVAAIRHNRPTDHAIRLGTTVGFAMPTFWVGLLLAFVFGVRLGWFPVSGYEEGLRGSIRSLTLPAVTVALFLSPVMLRLLRNSLVDVLGLDFVDALRGRGLSERRVILRHALKNSLLSTITIVAVSVGYLLGGTVVIENVFQIPGLGSLLVQSILDRDYPTVQALVLLFGLIVVFVNIAADMLYAVVDPRIRLNG